MTKHYCKCSDKECKVEVSIVGLFGEDLWDYYKKMFPEGLVIDRKTHEDNIPAGYQILHAWPSSIMIKKV